MFHLNSDSLTITSFTSTSYTVPKAKQTLIAGYTDTALDVVHVPFREKLYIIRDVINLRADVAQKCYYCDVLWFVLPASSIN